MLRKVVAGALMALVFSIGCVARDDDVSPDGMSDPKEWDVQIFLMNLQFYPDNIFVYEGSTVVWYNYDYLGHTITSGRNDEPSEQPGEVFDYLAPSGGSFRFTFTEERSYPYFCRSHLDDGMKGMITVIRR